MQRIITFIILLCISSVDIHSASVSLLAFRYFYVSYPRYRDEPTTMIYATHKYHDITIKQLLQIKQLLFSIITNNN